MSTTEHPAAVDPATAIEFTMQAAQRCLHHFDKLDTTTWAHVKNAMHAFIGGSEARNVRVLMSLEVPGYEELTAYGVVTFVENRSGVTAPTYVELELTGGGFRWMRAYCTAKSDGTISIDARHVGN